MSSSIQIFMHPASKKIGVNERFTHQCRLDSIPVFDADIVAISKLPLLTSSFYSFVAQ